MENNTHIADVNNKSISQSDIRAVMEKNIKKSNDEGLSSTINVAEIIRFLINAKKFIIITTSIVTIAAIIISLLLPEVFKSTSVLLPETDKNKLSGLGGISDLASLAGVGTGDASAIKLFPTILKSETILREVINDKYKTKRFQDSVNLIQYWQIKAKTPELAYETALAYLRTDLDVSMDIKTNVITITFVTEEPQLTADIINNISFELDRYMRTKRTTNATRQREWIETRLEEVKRALATSENNVKDFREKNRSIGGSPLLLLEQDRLLREVQINTALYGELKKQFELIRIEEIKNIPIVNVLDAAVPAARKDKPKRSIIVLTSFFLALLGSSGFVYFKHYYADRIEKIWRTIKN